MIAEFTFQELAWILLWTAAASFAIGRLWGIRAERRRIVRSVMKDVDE